MIYTCYYCYFYLEIMSSATIIVRHLPPQLSCEQKEEFLRYFGAKHIKILTSKKNNRCIAYARYKFFFEENVFFFTLILGSLVFFQLDLNR